ncbi:MAG: hypothetical protein KatS3mg014_2560 [Actinomycetota bacterium]|nr:MAG: hypothetical protein KatS3mg014_2560 [Actinomycetota bacterium]
MRSRPSTTVRCTDCGGKLLPLVYLRRELGLPAHDDPGGNGARSVSIVVLQAEDRQFGLVVDGILDTEEIVVKPLGNLLKGISAYAGATIMGDGRVALILDVLGIAQRSRVVSEIHERGALDLAPSEGEGSGGLARQAVLLCEGPDGGRVAVPLDVVERLEEIPPERVEPLGGSSVVQYRGEILPLVGLDQVLEERRRRPRNKPSSREDVDRLSVLVLSVEGRAIGLVVDRICDIVEETLDLRPATRSGGARVPGHPGVA